MYDSLRPHGLYKPWNSSGQNTAVGSLSLLQGIFPIQGLNPGLPHCRRIPYQLSHQGSPRILEGVAYPFSRRSSRPRNRTRVSCIADILYQLSYQGSHLTTGVGEKFPLEVNGGSKCYHFIGWRIWDKLAQGVSNPLSKGKESLVSDLTEVKLPTKGIVNELFIPNKEET